MIICAGYRLHLANINKCTILFGEHTRFNTKLITKSVFIQSLQFIPSWVCSVSLFIGDSHQFSNLFCHYVTRLAFINRYSTSHKFFDNGITRQHVLNIDLLKASFYNIEVKNGLPRSMTIVFHFRLIRFIFIQMHRMKYNRLLFHFVVCLYSDIPLNIYFHLVL